MKKCRWCKKDIETVQSCSMTPVVGFNQRWQRITFGEEQDFTEELEKCPECNVLVGGGHHLYCPIEECPNCHKKINECGCFYKPKLEE